MYMYVYIIFQTFLSKNYTTMYIQNECRHCLSVIPTSTYCVYGFPDCDAYLYLHRISVWTPWLWCLSLLTCRISVWTPWLWHISLLTCRMIAWTPWLWHIFTYCRMSVWTPWLWCLSLLTQNKCVDSLWVTFIFTYLQNECRHPLSVMPSCCGISSKHTGHSNISELDT